MARFLTDMEKENLQLGTCEKLQTGGKKNVYIKKGQKHGLQTLTQPPTVDSFLNCNTNEHLLKHYTAERNLLNVPARSFYPCGIILT